MLRFTKNDTYSANRILYAGPNNHVRAHYVVRMSNDEAKTWPVEREVYSGPASYGDLAILNNSTICLLFEAGKYMFTDGIWFTSFDVNWLTNGQDSSL